MDEQAIELNEIIKRTSRTAYELLSQKGREIFFPKKGILAQAKDAKGKRIDATIGIALEDDGSPMRLPSIAKSIGLDPKEIFPYAPSSGKPELRRKWKEMAYAKNPSLRGKEISLPVVTSALTHGLSIIGYLFVNPADQILLPDLFWGNYKLIFRNAYSAEFIVFKTFYEQGFNIHAFREKIFEGTHKKIILLNFPNNPTGYTPTEKEVKEMLAILKEAATSGNKIAVIVDDAYYGLVYKDGVYAQSVFSELADLHENILAIKLDGATKEDYVWGLRIGFITYGIRNGSRELYEALESKTSGAVRGNISNASHLSQSLVYQAFSDPNYGEIKKEKFMTLKGRFEEVEKVLREHREYSGAFTPLPFNSGYFMCLKLINTNGEEVRQKLLREYDTGVIAIGDMLRIAFSAVPKKDIPELFDNIYKACTP